MENIKVTITKYKVNLTYHGNGVVEEQDGGKEGEYSDFSQQPDKSQNSKRKAIEEVASKISGLNSHALSSAKDLRKPFYYKLIVTRI